MGARRLMWIGLAIVMILGFAVYFRLWSIDYSTSFEDSNLIRKQFDLANREAMDESAEWRMRYDDEAEKATHCLHQLKEIQDTCKDKIDAAFDRKQLEKLTKENTVLLEQVKTLRRELADEKITSQMLRLELS